MLRCIVAACFAAGLWVVGGQETVGVAFYAPALTEMARRGYVGGWRGCMYGEVVADTIKLRDMLPEGERGCPTAPQDTYVLGLMRPLATDDARCTFTAEDVQVFNVVGYRVQMLWCGILLTPSGGWMPRMQVWQAPERAPSRVGA